MKKKFSAAQMEQLERLANLPDSEIDTTDIPEAPAGNWEFARRGDFYRPVKTPVTIRLDADVLAWFKAHAANGGYQTEINRVLRGHVVQSERQRTRSGSS